ncbi:VapE domain-containing protein [Xylanibacter ruminicola]|uniref:VapE domain-containing protein n=1 Tax=Xylanibacter ruminicola TaxID=839 RepID=UPI00048E8C9E|nr:VapE domain-containing protein [Xylanibacter ruminicola]
MSKMTINGESLGASLQNSLAVEQFLSDNYQFRRNILNGKVEYLILNTKQADSQPVWRTLTSEALNSIVRKAKQEQITKNSPKTDIQEVIYSDATPVYDPINEFLMHLPKWDGQNHLAKLFSRLPGISSEQLDFLVIWFRSAVAHWLQKDKLHANESVPTLIGSQGCGKSTFIARLLPPELQEYYLDHLNLSNKFDKEMALTNNLLVNLDELDAIRPSQQAALKQTLSKIKVNGRTIYGSSQQDRPRYASFVATTNNPHPLSDVTGSRRFICIEIPDGQYIDNAGEIDYEQLYAQLVYEVNELKAPYWFTNEQVARIQELNQNYTDEKDITEIIEACFRKPNEGEKVKAMNCTQMLELISKEYPSLKKTVSTKVHLGLAMKDLGFEHTERGHVKYYNVVPVDAA